ncbi:MAG: glutamyl-tRNA amidotransferase [Desulfuromonas sp.]|nr:MAG: glutamyl-tRNA amidotransferase [Desulfuromonas sp.]
MSLQEQLSDALKTAMKAKDTLRLSVVRGIRTAIKNKEIELGKSLSDEEIISILSTLAKQRRESATAFREGDREELAAKEEAELAILQEYLPQQLSEEELRGLVKAAIAETGASGMRDMGQVMKALMPKTTGRADGKLVSQLVRELLGA